MANGACLECGADHPMICVGAGDGVPVWVCPLLMAELIKVEVKWAGH